MGASLSGADRPFATFLMATTDAAGFPRGDLPEVAFLGRSNVGKSSLLNSLVGAKVAFTSNTPGRTRTVTFFDVALGSAKTAPLLRLADLPGYGFARISRAAAKEWPKFVVPYLEKRECLDLCVLLVDSAIPPQESDMAMMDLLRGAGRQAIVVATKVDKVAPSKRVSTLKVLGTALGVVPWPVSSKTGDGVDGLWQQVLLATGNTRRSQRS
jgi:GTP-binding protein